MKITPGQMTFFRNRALKNDLLNEIASDVEKNTAIYNFDGLQGKPLAMFWRTIANRYSNDTTEAIKSVLKEVGAEPEHTYNINLETGQITDATDTGNATN